MNREDLIKAMGEKFFPLRTPRHHQLKKENEHYKNEMQSIDETLEDEDLDIDIMSRSFIKTKHRSKSKIKDDYDDIWADKLCRKSWKDKRKSKHQYRGEN